jgi:hypothetical protein
VLRDPVPRGIEDRKLVRIVLRLIVDAMHSVAECPERIQDAMDRHSIVEVRETRNILEEKDSRAEVFNGSHKLSEQPISWVSLVSLASRAKALARRPAYNYVDHPTPRALLHIQFECLHG